MVAERGREAWVARCCRFQGPAPRSRCHLGPLLSDEAFHNTGVAWREGVPADPGRAAVTGRPEDVGSFKTPTLREVSRTVGEREV